MPEQCPHCRGKKSIITTLCLMHFKALQNLWYTKLKKSGFKDLEDKQGNLKTDGDRRNLAAKDQEAIQAYYSAARQHLNHYNFPSPTEQRLWSMHCEGVPMRKIAKEIGTSTYYVFDRIEMHRRIAGIAKRKKSKKRTSCTSLGAYAKSDQRKQAPSSRVPSKGRNSV